MSAQRLGDYELGSLLGSGTMGAVWRARQTGAVEREVAIKRLAVPGDPVQRARLRREAETLAALDHPHIVRILELVPDGEGLAIVMPLAAGGSLADLLADLGGLRPEQLARIAAPVAEALASAHRRGVVHRDVKPSNIVFTADGEPLLTDFGIAWLAGAQRLTAQTGAALGTAGYLDPEVAAGGEPGPAADQYALGVVCWQALAGRMPFAGEGPLAVLRAADLDERPALGEAAPDVPPALAAAVERCIHRDPAARFPDLRAFADAVRAAVPPAAGSGRAGDEPARPDGSAPAPARSAQPAQPPPAASAVARPGAPRGLPAPPAAAADSGTRTFGPRPPCPVEVDEAPARRWLAPALVLAVLAAGLAAGGWWWLSARAGPEPAATEPAGGPAVPEPDCPPPARPEVPDGARLLAGDVDGDGCPSYVLWDGETVEAELDAGEPPVAFRFTGDDPGALTGEEALLLGDWNCDGVDTPAVYTPADGRVHYFDRWPDTPGTLGESRSFRTGILDGAARIVTGDDGCDAVRVADGD